MDCMLWSVDIFCSCGSRIACWGTLISDTGTFRWKHVQRWKNWVLLGGGMPVAPPGSITVSNSKASSKIHEGTFLEDTGTICFGLCLSVSKPGCAFLLLQHNNPQNHLWLLGPGIKLGISHLWGKNDTTVLCRHTIMSSSPKQKFVRKYLYHILVEFSSGIGVDTFPYFNSFWGMVTRLIL